MGKTCSCGQLIYSKGRNNSKKFPITEVHEFARLKKKSPSTMNLKKTQMLGISLQKSQNTEDK